MKGDFMVKETKDSQELEAEEEALVNEATKVVMDFIRAKHTNSIEVGRYLIEKFYDNDFERARKGKKAKGESLNKMLDKLEREPNTPSKSWFYNTIKLAVDDEAFKDVPDYAKLNLTHKICLTYLSKEKWQAPKLDLIKEISKDGMSNCMSIKKLRERIAEIKARPSQKWPSLEEIQRMPDKAKKKITDKATRRQKTLQNTIDKLKRKLDEQESELRRYTEIITAVEGTAGPSGEPTAEELNETPVQADVTLPDNQLAELMTSQSSNTMDNTSEAA
jgi:hypothetical protein